MTAVFGYASTADRKAVLATDDKRVGDPGRVEKIVRVDDRFIVACFGQDSPIDALRMIAWRRSQARADFNFISVEALVRATLEALNAYVGPLGDRLSRAILAGEAPEAVRDRVARQDATLVILDCLKFELFTANIGRPLPVGNMNNPPAVTRQAQATLLGYSGAVLPNNFNGALLTAFAADPEPDLVTWMATSKATYPEAVGGLGMWVQANGDDVNLHSTFDSVTDALSQPLRADYRFLIATVSYERR